MAVRVFSKEQVIQILKQLGYEPVSLETEYAILWKNNKNRGFMLKHGNDPIPYWVIDKILKETPFTITFSGELVSKDPQALN